MAGTDRGDEGHVQIRTCSFLDTSEFGQIMIMGFDEVGDAAAGIAEQARCSDCACELSLAGNGVFTAHTSASAPHKTSTCLSTRPAQTVEEQRHP
jgi:hypothetical protein